MDFDQFEACNGKTKGNVTSGCSIITKPTTTQTAIDIDQFEDWEDYMDYGMGGPRRDHFGFRLPHRTANDV
jgi:hypothetical protein